jgi:serine/threonine protein kinase
MSGNDTADYARLKDAFLELIDLDPRQREVRLDAIQAEHPTLGAALRRQLGAAAQPLPLLDRASDAPVVPELPHYTIVRELGRGGMGVVWLAERALGDARQRVALKQIAHAHWSADDLRRFQRERRILAGLDHPNIAALVDGGTDARGQAFLATQFVDGVRLDLWCANNKPGLRARIELLRRIVGAVAYAHGQLVVHRDLKPANILVTSEGMPRLLDFGIARALHEDAVTTEGPSQMTLRYAAPEQVASDGSEGGVGVDIYALGVIMYELLAGASPYRDASGAAALVHAILHESPLAPSRVLGAPSGIDADLDAICLKALRKPVYERYASAGALLADLDRWLAREPVDARRGERGYRLRAFTRRHWVGLSITAVATLAVLGAGLWEMRSQREQIAALKVERDKARAISHFFDELFSAAPPNRVSSGDITARELLRLAATRLQDEGITAIVDDDARASLYKAASTAMVRQDLLPESGAMLDRAIELWRQVTPTPVDDLASALHERARIAHLQGQGELALQLQAEAISIAESNADSDRTMLAGLINAHSVMLWMSGQTEAAMEALERSAAILREELPKGQVYYANNMRNLAMYQLYAGRAEQGLASARESLAKVRELKPERTSDVFGAEMAVAAAIRELGRFDEADAMYRDIVTRLRAWSAVNNQVLADALLSYAKLLLLQQRWGEAEAMLREIEAIHVAQGGENHPRALGTRAELALVAIGRERWIEAEASLSEVARLRGDAAPTQGSTTAFEQVALAYARCRTAGAVTRQHEDALRAAIEVLQRHPPLPRARLQEAGAWLLLCRAPRLSG